MHAEDQSAAHDATASASKTLDLSSMQNTTHISTHQVPLSNVVVMDSYLSVIKKCVMYMNRIDRGISSSAHLTNEN